MNNWWKKYPPYEGGEPYLYFAFAEADAGKVWEVMRLLLERGCRVWYCLGPASSPDEVLRRQNRYKGAALTLVYLSDASCKDPNTKSNVLVNQSTDSPILCLDPDGKDRRLAMGLAETVPHIPLYKLRSSEELEEALLHAEGFSQDLLGEPVKIANEGTIYRKLTAVFSALAIILLIFLLLGIRKAGSAQTQIEQMDEVKFSDPVIMTAVREAAGGGALTEESISGITSISLTEMPGSWDDLSLLPALTEIRLPQESLLGDDPLPEGDYTIRLQGGGS